MGIQFLYGSYSQTLIEQYRLGMTGYHLSKISGSVSPHLRNQITDTFSTDVGNLITDAQILQGTYLTIKQLDDTYWLIGKSTYPANQYDQTSTRIVRWTHGVVLSKKELTNLGNDPLAIYQQLRPNKSEDILANGFPELTKSDRQRQINNLLTGEAVENIQKYRAKIETLWQGKQVELPGLGHEVVYQLYQLTPDRYRAFIPSVTSLVNKTQSSGSPNLFTLSANWNLQTATTNEYAPEDKNVSNDADELLRLLESGNREALEQFLTNLPAIDKKSPDKTPLLTGDDDVLAKVQKKQADLNVLEDENKALKEKLSRIERKILQLRDENNAYRQVQGQNESELKKMIESLRIENHSLNDELQAQQNESDVLTTKLVKKPSWWYVALAFSTALVMGIVGGNLWPKADKSAPGRTETQRISSVSSTTTTSLTSGNLDSKNNVDSLKIARENLKADIKKLQEKINKKYNVGYDKQSIDDTKEGCKQLLKRIENGPLTNDSYSSWISSLQGLYEMPVKLKNPPSKGAPGQHANDKKGAKKNRRVIATNPDSSTGAEIQTVKQAATTQTKPDTTEKEITTIGIIKKG